MKRSMLAKVGVVIATLLILAAILLPVRLRAVELRRRAWCLSNMNFLGLALKMYSQDFDDRYAWNVGRTNPEEAWRDLGLLYPGYTSVFRSYFCPSSREDGSRAAKRMGEKAFRPSPPQPHGSTRPPYRGEPLESTGSHEVISYAYGMDARDAKRPVAWTEAAHFTVRLLADKKAGVPLEKRSNHKLDGRNVLYNDGHAKWQPGTDAVGPNAQDDTIGAPGAKDYRAWWSDPPFYGE